MRLNALVALLLVPAAGACRVAAIHDRGSHAREVRMTISPQAIRQRRLRERAAALITALAVPVIAACAPTEIKWTEEVKLHDGKVIQVKRRIELSATGFPTSSRGKPLYHELCYAPMGIYWKSNSAYEPELFDLIDGKAYVRVPLGGCSSCKLHNFPKSNSLYFVWDAGQWNQIAVDAFPPQLRFNLLNRTHGDDDGAHDARGLIRLAEKEERDATIYRSLAIAGVKSTSERLPVRNLCEKCSRVDIQTNAPRQVLLPNSAKACNW